MFGCESMATACASVWNRARNSSSWASSSRSIFTATYLFSLWHMALYTTAMPPVPMTSSISYLSSRYVPRYLSILVSMAASKSRDLFG